MEIVFGWFSRILYIVMSVLKVKSIEIVFKLEIIRWHAWMKAFDRRGSSKHKSSQILDALSPPLKVVELFCIRAIIH